MAFYTDKCAKFVGVLYAVVDIETTGGYAAAGGITEIAIVIHDGEKVLDFYESLVNPHMPIPYFIQRLTGIDDSMVAFAPSFEEIAARVHELLEDKVFVAHNVNFDYSFVKYHLDCAGYELNNKKLCTVRLARKVMPGLNGYSLGKLTQQLGITHTQAHRAGGDALATADLLKLLIENDTKGAIATMLKIKNGEQYLPPHLPVEDMARLPETPGVYYFYNTAGKVIYIGKAINIRKRVKSHFSNNKINRQKQDFLKETRHISFKKCGTELMAHILESSEIRRLWPVYNRSQRGYLPQFGLFSYEDRGGYLRFKIEKNKQSVPPIYTFNTLMEGQSKLRELISEFGLCARLCNLSPSCDCTTHAPADDYNALARKAMLFIRKSLPSFALIDKGIEHEEQSCILIKDGTFYGMGYLTNKKQQLTSIETLQQALEPFQDNDFIRNLVFRYATDYPEKCITF